MSWKPSLNVPALTVRVASKSYTRVESSGLRMSRLCTTREGMTRILFIALFVGLIGPSAGAQTITFAPYTFEAGDGKSVEAERGELTVRENRSKRDSRMIKLEVVRFKSTSQKPGHPIVYLAGGPGGSGIDAARSSRFPLFMALRELGDVIALDQRGIHDLSCDETYAVDPSAPLERSALGAAINRAVRKCVAARGIDLAAYNTRESAADLADLRKALGARKLILWGISYGTHLSIATMRFHPDLVDRAILAGIEGPDDTYKLPSDQQTLLEEIARLSARGGNLPDLLGAINDLTRELERSPKRIEITDPMSGQKTTVTLGKLDLQLALAGMLVGPDTFAGLPGFVARLQQGDWLSLALGAERSGRAPGAMSVAMDCASGISAARRRVIEEEAPRTHLGDAINIPFPEVCAGLDIPDLGDVFRAPLVSSVPALLISGTLDGRTRPRQAEELRRTMPNAQHLVIEGAGHSDPLFVSSPKILEAMLAFLRGERIADRYIELPPVTFSPARVIVEVSDAKLSTYEGRYATSSLKLLVKKGGSTLFIIPEGGGALALRPISQTEFFSDSFASTVRFELAATGKPLALLFDADGSTIRAVRE